MPKVTRLSDGRLKENRRANAFIWKVAKGPLWDARIGRKLLVTATDVAALFEPSVRGDPTPKVQRPSLAAAVPVVLDAMAAVRPEDRGLLGDVLRMTVTRDSPEGRAILARLLIAADQRRRGLADPE